VGTGGKISEAKVHVVPEGGIGLVYCTDPGTAPADRKRVHELLAGQEGIADVVDPDRFAEYGLPHPREYAQAPDLVIVAKDGYGVSGLAEGDGLVAPSAESRVSVGSHGFVSKEPKMNAVCILSGNGIRSGVLLKNVENIDIAPTVAQLLNLATFDADGRVLNDALTGQ
jgi:hypothetical protein